MSRKLITIFECEGILESDPLKLIKENYFYNIDFKMDEVRLQGHRATNVFSDEIVLRNFKITDDGFIRRELKSEKFGIIIFSFEI